MLSGAGYRNPRPTGGELRVAMVAPYPDSPEAASKGGVLQSTYYLVDALSRQAGVELAVLTPRVGARRLEVREIGNARVLFVPVRPLGPDALWGYWWRRRAIRKWLRFLKPDLVHAVELPPYVLEAARYTGSHIVTIHGIFAHELAVRTTAWSAGHWLRRRILVAQERAAFPRMQNVIAITAEIAGLARRANPDVNVFRIDNPIDDGFFGIQGPGIPGRVLFVGWVNHRKGLHLLLAAAENLAARIPGFTVHIVGSDELDRGYGQALRQRYAKLLDSGVAVFRGTITQEELYQEVRECAVLCLPSLAESAPLAIAQALAAGRPVVASAVGGIPEMIEDHVTGRLFPRGQEEALQSCLQEVLQERALAELGRQARRVARERYHRQSVAARTVAAYRSVWSRKAIAKDL